MFFQLDFFYSNTNYLIIADVKLSSIFLMYERRSILLPYFWYSNIELMSVMPVIILLRM